MSAVQDFSDGLIAALTATLTDTTFSPGKAPDNLPPATTAVGFVWVTDIAEDESNKHLEHITAGVRIYPIQTEQFDGLTPINPSTLYTVATTVQTCLGAAWQSEAATVWFWEVLNVSFDHDNQYIEAEVRAQTWSDSAKGN